MITPSCYFWKTSLEKRMGNCGITQSLEIPGPPGKFASTIGHGSDCVVKKSHGELPWPLNPPKGGISNIKFHSLSMLFSTTWLKQSSDAPHQWLTSLATILQCMLFACFSSLVKSIDILIKLPETFRKHDSAIAKMAGWPKLLHLLAWWASDEAEDSCWIVPEPRDLNHSCPNILASKT